MHLQYLASEDWRHRLEEDLLPWIRSAGARAGGRRPVHVGALRRAARRGLPPSLRPMITVLAGGVGAARYLAGLLQVVPAEEVSLEPEVFYRLTSNWLELAVRFVVPTHDIRRVKSDVTRSDQYEGTGSWKRK